MGLGGLVWDFCWNFSWDFGVWRPKDSVWSEFLTVCLKKEIREGESLEVLEDEGLDLEKEKREKLCKGAGLQRIWKRFFIFLLDFFHFWLKFFF